MRFVVILFATLFLSACGTGESVSDQAPQESNQDPAMAGLNESEKILVDEFANTWCEQRHLISYEAWTTIRVLEDEVAWGLDRDKDGYCAKLGVSLVQRTNLYLNFENAEKIDLRPLSVLRRLTSLTIHRRGDIPLQERALLPLKSLSSLVELSLSYVRMDSLSTDDLPDSIRTLTVDGMGLEELEIGYTSGIETLNAAFNRLEAIPQASSLRSVSVEGNPIHFNSISSAFQYPELKVLKITFPSAVGESERAEESLKKAFPNAVINPK